MILYMYIAPGKGLTIPWGRNFDVNRNILPLRSYVASLNKNLFEVWFQYTTFFMILYMYILPQGRGRQPPGDKFLVSTELNVLSLYSFFASLKKKCLWSLILYNVIMI